MGHFISYWIQNVHIIFYICSKDFSEVFNDDRAALYANKRNACQYFEKTSPQMGHFFPQTGPKSFYVLSAAIKIFYPNRDLVFVS